MDVGTREAMCEWLQESASEYEPERWVVPYNDVCTIPKSLQSANLKHWWESWSFHESTGVSLVDWDHWEVHWIYQIYLSVSEDQTSQSECKTYLGTTPAWWQPTNPAPDNQWCRHQDHIQPCSSGHLDIWWLLVSYFKIVFSVVFNFLKLYGQFATFWHFKSLDYDQGKIRKLQETCFFLAIIII